MKRVKIILASSSPRRRALLKSIGIKFDWINPNIKEKILSGESPQDYVQRNSLLKAQNALNIYRPKSKTIFIGADTIVFLQNKILEKPQNKADAYKMLSFISAKTHTVISGVSIVNYPENKKHTIVVETKVKIKPLSEKEINSYIESEEPLDKAGSYAIQGKGAYMIETINGSYTNVVGLPLSEVYNLLMETL